MTRIRNSIEIARDIDEVFSFATTPRFWQEWHPSTVGVDGDEGGPLLLGEVVTEEFRAFGRSHRARWRVTEYVPPHRWVAEGRQIQGGVATLAYTFRRSTNGTLLTGEFCYQMSGLLLSMVDRLMVRQRITQESEHAVRRLKALLEDANATARCLAGHPPALAGSAEPSRFRRREVHNERR